LLTHL
jgi:urease